MNVAELYFNFGGILEGLSMVIAGASVLANFTKTDKDNKALSKAGKAINFLALNFKRTKGGYNG